MENRLTLLSLSDSELDLVHAGRHMAAGRSSSLSQTGKVSIGEIVVFASGNANVTIDVIGVNSSMGGGMAKMHHGNGGHLRA